MASLDKTVLKNNKKKRYKTAFVYWILWSVLSIYLAYYIDAALMFVFKKSSFKTTWNIYEILTRYGKDSALPVWYLVLQLIFIGFTAWIFLQPTSRLKDIQTMQITDDILIPKAVGNGQYGSARFATQKEFEAATNGFLFSGNEEVEGRGGLVVEMKKIGGKELIKYIGGSYHSLILGTTGSGKTRRILLESVCLQIMAGTSIAVSDVKGEIFYYTSQFAEKNNYKVLAMDFRQPEKSARYNFLEPILEALENHDRAKAIDCTWDLVSVLVGEPKGEPLWHNGETSTIAAAILCVAIEADRKYRNLANVYYFLSYMCMPDPETGKMPLNEYLKTLPDNHPAKGVFAMAQVAASRTRSSFFTSALGTLRLFTNPKIAAMTAESDFNLKDIGKRKSILYMIVPDEKKTMYPLVSLLIQQLYMEQVEVANQNGLVLPVPTDYDLDEVGNFPVIPVLENIASAGRARGIRMNLVLQDYQQMKEKYKEAFETIKTCCQVKVLLKTDNPGTVKEISETLGQYTVETPSTSSSTNTGRNSDTSYGNSSNMTGRFLLTPEEISRIKSPYALVMQMGEHPAITKLPDLSQYIWNELLGLGDEKHNQELIQQREQQRSTKSFHEDIPLWGIWKKYQNMLEDEAKRQISFLK